MGETEFNRYSMDATAASIDLLLRLMPEAVGDGQVNIDVLRDLLGDYVAPDAAEKYQFTWNGKSNARRIAQTPSTGTLRPLGETETGLANFVIEGDNLEVLKLLQKSYYGKVKMIYIDPPYNTGKEFIYPDRFKDNLDTYLHYTGQVSEEGYQFSANTEGSGRFHTNWLNMMYPRLRLARNLLRDDGVIFVSIDDNELANLKKICDEIFGEENFVEVFSWVRTSTPAALAAKTKKTTEYILCYERSLSSQRYEGLQKPVQSPNPLLNQPNPVSTLVFPAASVTTGIPDGLVSGGAYGTERYSVELLSDAEVKDGRFVTELALRARFRWSQSYLESQLDSGVRVHIATIKMIPSYEKDSYGREALPNLIDAKVGVGTNENATTELRSLLPDAPNAAIDLMHPKPVSLIKYLVDAVCSPEDLVLDFFAGSGTTAQAVLELNATDGGSRRFLLIQLPEPIEEDVQAGGTFRSIADVCRERVSRVIRRLDAATPGFADRSQLGFLRLDDTNVRGWDSELETIAASLLDSVESIKPDRTDLDVLYEVLLKAGLDLGSPVRRVAVGDSGFYVAAAGALILALNRVDDALVQGIVRAHRELRPEYCRAVLADAAYGNDQAKVNAVNSLLAAGIDEVKSI